MADPRISFYLDEHDARAVALGLRRRGIDVLTVQEAGLAGESDRGHLTLATAQGRVIFTQDDDFLRLHAQGIPHAGIIYGHRRMPVGDVIRGLVIISHVLSPDEMRDHVEFL
jgi:hypothetical protein